MKQILGLIGLLIGLLFIVSCVPQTVYYDCSDGSRVTNPAACPVPAQPTGGDAQGQETIPLETQPPVSVKGVITEAAQALFSNFTKVSSISYAYVESPDVLPKDIYYVSEEKMKIFLAMRNSYNASDWYDTVYLDLVQKTGTGYCEKNIALCPDRNKMFIVDFSKFIVDTPFDWMSRITAANLTGRSKTLESRKAVEVQFEIDGKPGTMFVDFFFSTPLYIFFDGKTYEFRDIAINEAKATDLTHQTTQ